MNAMQADLEMVTWLRAAVLERKALAGAATPGPWGFEGDDPTDDELFTVHDGIVDLVGQAVAYTRHRQVANGRLMEANDPQDTIARCEAELDILNAHYILHREDRSEEYAEYSVTPHPGAYGCDFGCVSCHYRGLGGVWGQGVCYTVRRMALGYRHWPGWKEKWGAWHSTSPSTTTG